MVLLRLLIQARFLEALRYSVGLYIEYLCSVIFVLVPFKVLEN